MSQRYICQTPKDCCNGGKGGTSQGLNRKNSMKMHSTPQEAFNCYAQYLVSQGYERLSSREFRQPEGGILVLTKPCRYGGRLRRGKSAEGTGSSRFMPDSKGHTTRSGLFIG